MLRPKFTSAISSVGAACVPRCGIVNPTSAERRKAHLLNASSNGGPAITSATTTLNADGSVTYSFQQSTDVLKTTAPTAERRFQSSWDAKDARGGSSPDADYLYELGRSDLNLNIDTGQNSTNLDSLFTGNVQPKVLSISSSSSYVMNATTTCMQFLGHQSDIADGSLRHDWEFRQFNNIVGDYYVAPRFLDAIAMHIVKNFLLDQGSFDAVTRVPLILGIWGGKGQGKSFQTELAFKKLGVEAVVMSAGELESERAGEPGKMIRERYRKAAEMSRVRGRLSCLLINDLDAGVGRFENTQHTVNNQMVIGSLMNICDNPNKVPLYGVEWREEERIRRIPIIVTGNDLSTVFAPLLRDGRMDKFWWQPTLTELTSIVHQMYKDDNLPKAEVETLLKAFPNQSLDFFGAMRAATYDNQIREWIKRDVVKGEMTEDNENMKELGRRLVRQENLPEFKPVDVTLAMLMKEGQRLVEEQDKVNSMRLSDDYFKKQTKIGKSILGLSG